MSRAVRPPCPGTILVCLLCLACLAASAPTAVAAGREVVDPAPVRREATWTAPPVDVPRLRAEDAVARERKEIPARVGFPMKTDITPTNSGVWSDLPGGDRLWQLRVQSKQALWVVVGFTEFKLQPGAELFVSDGSRRHVLGPFTSRDIRSHGQLWFPPVVGDHVLIELHWPAELADEAPALRMGTVSHGYREWAGIDADNPDKDAGGGVSGACNNDVACPEGDGWGDQVRSVVRILSGGFAFCTGALVNTTANDCRPYVLTASHCNVNPPTTTFQFDYQRSVCGGGTVETSHSRTGATRLARWPATDVDLLKLDEDPDEAWGVFWSGWNRGTAPGTRSTGIHHPQGDVKKISHNYDAVVDGLADGWGSSHWRVTEWEDGTTEPSSSGSPLYDQNKLIVGQLHGGAASCTNIEWDEYGKLSQSWTGGGTIATRLSDWLDPLGQGPQSIPGLDQVACGTPQPVLELSDVTLDDSAGNGNLIAEPGETLLLSPLLANNGTDVATGVTGTLSTTTPLVSLDTDTAAWPDLATGAEATPIVPFTVRLDPAFSCGQSVEFRLDADADQGSWSTGFKLPTGVQAGTAVTLADNVESGSTGWTVLDQFPPNSNLWFQTSVRSHSPVKSWFVNDIESKSDALLMLAPLTDLAPGTTLTFWHYLNSEPAFDGGVLEYSIDGGANWSDAGPLVTAGHYNLTIDTGWESALAGRPAWTGDLNGWRQVTADLSILAGHDVRLRWRFATDTLFGDEGWFIDDVTISHGVFDCESAVSQPGEAAASDSAAPFRIGRDGDGYQLTWGAPMSGGAATEYLLYSRPIGATKRVSPNCEGSLGAGLAATRGTLPDDSVFIVVARNSAGEGSYGADSNGAARPASVAPCP